MRETGLMVAGHAQTQLTDARLHNMSGGARASSVQHMRNGIFGYAWQAEYSSSKGLGSLEAHMRLSAERLSSLEIFCDI